MGLGYLIFKFKPPPAILITEPLDAIGTAESFSYLESKMYVFF